jgi:hypothetical protein
MASLPHYFNPDPALPLLCPCASPASPMVYVLLSLSLVVLLA